MNVYPFIEAENAGSGNVKRACELLKVSRAAYYAHRSAEPSARERTDAELTEEIVAIHDESKGTYGTPRLHAELRARGRRHSRKRVARLLRASGRAGRAPKRWRTTTIPDPAATTPVDLIKRDFSCDAQVPRALRGVGVGALKVGGSVTKYKCLPAAARLLPLLRAGGARIVSQVRIADRHSINWDDMQVSRQS